MSTSKFSEQVPLEVGETWEETYEKYCNDMQRGWLAHITKEVRNNDQLTEWTRSFTWEGHLGSGKHANYALSRKSIPLRTGSFYITPTGTALISRILATAWWGSSKTELGIGPSLHMSDHERSRLKFSEPGRHRELRENEPFTPQHTAGAQRRFATTSQHPTNERTELRPLAIKSPEQSSVGYQQTQYPSMSDGTQPQQPAAQQRYSGHFSDPAQFVGEYNSHPPSRRNNRSQIPIQHESRPPAQMSPSGNLFSPPQVGLAMSAHEMYAEDVCMYGESDTSFYFSNTSPSYHLQPVQGSNFVHAQDPTYSPNHSSLYLQHPLGNHDSELPRNPTYGSGEDAPPFVPSNPSEQSAYYNSHKGSLSTAQFVQSAQSTHPVLQPSHGFGNNLFDSPEAVEKPITQSTSSHMFPLSFPHHFSC